MPYETVWTDPEVYVTHKGVTVYHLYKNDDIEQGARTYSFTLHPQAGEADWGVFPNTPLFDVRDLPGFTDGPWNERAGIIREFVIAAIDAGIITQDGVKKKEVAR